VAAASVHRGEPSCAGSWALLMPRYCPRQGRAPFMWGRPRALCTSRPTRVGTPEGMALARDTDVAQAQELPLLPRGSDNRSRRGSRGREFGCLGGAVRRLRRSAHIDPWGGRPDVPDPLPRVAHGGHPVAVQGEHHCAPIPRREREVALSRPLHRLAGEQVTVDRAPAIDSEQEPGLFFGPDVQPVERLAWARARSRGRATLGGLYGGHSCWPRLSHGVAYRCR